MNEHDILAPAVSESVHIFRARVAADSGLFYGGPKWYAHVCHALKHQHDGATLGDLGLSVSSLDTGITTYEAGDLAYVRMLCSGAYPSEKLAAALRYIDTGAQDSFTASFGYAGSSTEYSCDISLAAEAHQLKQAVAGLQHCDRLTLRFHTPARIKNGYTRREHYRRPGYIKKAAVYMDERTFSLSALLRACWARLCSMRHHPFIDPNELAFSGTYRLFDGESPWLEAVPLSDSLDALVQDVNLMWLRTPYSKSKREEKDIGGVIGEVQIQPQLPEFWLYCLLAAGRRHVGEFSSFGFGRIEIREASPWYHAGKCSPPVTLLDRATSPQRLRGATKSLGGKAGDVYGATPADAAYARSDWFVSLRERALSGTLTPGPMKPYRFEKKDSPGAYREIFIPALPDRILQRAVHELIAPSIDTFLSTSSFAYRRGLNREGALRALQRAQRKGYRWMVKADIESFFDRVSWPLLATRLQLLYGTDPLVSLLLAWVKAPAQRASGIVERKLGLPQGMVLSPLLANLVLDILDAELEKHDLRLIRYCDDFVVLARSEPDAKEALQQVRKQLDVLGLCLHEDKTQIIKSGTDFSFLGYRVSNEANDKDDYSPADPDPEYDLPFSVFSPLATRRRTVYLGGQIRGVRCHNENLVFLNRKYKQVGMMPWKKVARIIMSGRINATAAVHRKALQKGIPILFLNIWGKALGETIPAFHTRPGLVDAQRLLVNNQEQRFLWVRDTISARLNNMGVVLSRNGIDKKALQDLSERMEKSETVGSLRGYEGAGTRIFWGHFAELTSPFLFTGRQYRPPKDPVNAMLSCLYTLLHHRMACILRLHGFDPAVGFFHEPRSGHAALASDMMEEFRHYMELIVLRVIHKRMIKVEWFDEKDLSGGHPCVLPDAAFRVLVNAFETRMQKEFKGRNNKQMSLVEVMEDQVCDLRAALLLGQRRNPFRIY